MLLDIPTVNKTVIQAKMSIVMKKLKNPLHDFSM